jgi:hypothetical protein
MQYELDKAIQILQRTPATLRALLEGLDDEWIINNEGENSFSPYDVVGHMVHGEKTDWVARTNRILTEGEKLPFDSFDRFAMYEESKGKSMSDLLREFEQLRIKNIEWLRSLDLRPGDFTRKGTHPVLGTVTLGNLLSTWVAHDLTHIAQITRVMAKQYKDAMGPWPEFFRILHF